MKTGQQIVTDFIALIRGTSLASAIGGSIYRGGTRPRDSKAEDLVVIFTTADAEQFQEGVVTLNIFVPDIPTSQNGVLLQNSARCEEIEGVAQESVGQLTAATSDYRIRLRNAISTNRDEEIGQSFVSVSIRFSYIN